MIALPSPTRRAAPWLPVLLALGLSACGDGAVPYQGPFEPSFAKPASGDPVVGTVDPSSAPQDTTVDVTVNGSDFDAGSVVTLTLNGVATGKVVTNSTVYVSARKLVANVTIAADAESDLYDVEVMTSRGKKGVGTDAFQVQQKNGGGSADTDSRAVWQLFGTTADGAASGLLGDGRDADGNGSALDPTVYQGDRCGVVAKIFAVNPSMSQSGDAVLHPEMDYPGVSCGAVRQVLADLGGGSTRTLTGINVRCVMQLVPGWGGEPCFYSDTTIDPNDPTVGYSAMGATISDRFCERLRWNPEVAGGATSGAVKVRYLGATGPGGANQWLAETQPPHAAGCYDWKKGTFVWDGVTRTVPFRVVITEVPYVAS